MSSSSLSITSPSSSSSSSSSIYATTQISTHTTNSLLHRRVSFRVSTKPKLRFLLSKVSTNSLAETKEKNSLKDSSSSSLSDLATQESISEFLTQVTTLVKLVDDRDIVEMQLKQLDCELTMPPPPPPPSPSPQAASTPASLPSPSTPTTPKSSLPTVKSPMAGTFYRSPGPGEPPFIKVGDKVKKGQVLCIVEAMKLMNEIESDQTGTVVDIVAEDGKPVSLDTPLFVVQP
ncbi:unnamed protein product [Cochlearia groenlandica]